MECLWCDTPTVNGDKLCPTCRAANDHPPFHCPKPGHEVPTLGPSCFNCDIEQEARERRDKINAPIIASLEAIRAQHIRDFHKPWPGCEFGKAIIGMSIDGALAELKGNAK
jgi:hypothetical protein